MINYNTILKLLCVLLFISFDGHSQKLLKSNIVLIIDNQLVTGSTEINFVSSENKVLHSHLYEIGKELHIQSDIFKEAVYITFDYIGNADSVYKTYSYRIKFSGGYLYNSGYMILRIYNLDKPEFKEAFCDVKGEYVMDVQNQVYHMNQIPCKELKCKL